MDILTEEAVEKVAQALWYATGTFGARFENESEEVRAEARREAKELLRAANLVAVHSTTVLMNKEHRHTCDCANVGCAKCSLAEEIAQQALLSWETLRQ